MSMGNRGGCIDVNVAGYCCEALEMFKCGGNSLTIDESETMEFWGFDVARSVDRFRMI